MVNDHDFLDVAQNLDTRKSSNYIWRTRPPSTIANDECLVMAQLEEMVRATSGITACDDPDPRAGTYGRILVLEDFLNIVIVGGLEVERDIRIERSMSECFRHGVWSDKLSEAYVCYRGREKRASKERKILERT